MPLNRLTYRIVERKLKKAGFEKVSQKGSYVKFHKAEESSTRIVIVPKHKEIAIGTLRSIIRQTGMTSQEFEEL